MVIRPQTREHETYAVRMLSGNNIRGLLPFQDKNLNGEVNYYYDITSKQPLSRILEHRNLSGDELKELISELLYTLKQLERFFLDEGQLCLLPEYIYVEPASFKASFCLIPGRKAEFAAELCELSQYLLDHVNQSDGEAVVLAFSVFKECRKLNFGIEDIERCLRQQDLNYKEGRETAIEQSGPEIRKEAGFRESPNTEVNTEPDKKTAPEISKGSRSQTDAENPMIKKNSSFSLPILLFAVTYIFLMILVPFVLLLLAGLDGVQSKLSILIAGELLAAVILVLIFTLFIKKAGKTCERKLQPKKQKKENTEKSKNLLWNEYPILREKEEHTGDDSDEEPWEVYFRQLNEEEEMPEERKNYIREDDPDEFRTVLLSARPIEKESRKLIPVNGGNEIPIGYYPFLIGKGRDLTDYCLDQPGVSRLHVKIEESRDGYIVTDLNSTNGTAVNGVLIEANGTAQLFPGDELTIAAERYRFR